MVRELVVPDEFQANLVYRVKYFFKKQTNHTNQIKQANNQNRDFSKIEIIPLNTEAI